MSADRLLQMKQEEVCLFQFFLYHNGINLNFFQIRRMQEQLMLMQEQLRQNSRPVSNAQSLDDLLNE